ncbi:hypothetical protein EV193_102262 [Herbihabitans rhizosphaerae]|uniref:VOC domain-containing protein n=1 Tax=Herbihabitans rhizosphaerae TaxID=1872711 RepID=A0A4V2EU44_9PSEU|nr:VOC family protein [Herbihabitans rhizosphaerae]RZS43283.1 hypothetical protein EV193_102262 [Herbihabitans rhizosphaerae]
MPRPVHFEIHATNPDRARTFYETVFGWAFVRLADNPYWLIQTGDGPGIDGALTPRLGVEPALDAPMAAFPLTIDVPDLDGFTNAVTIAGGLVVVTRSAVPAVGWLAYCRDTEGNLFGLMQTDIEAR